MKERLERWGRVVPTFTPSHRAWRRALPEEVEFWRRWIESGGLDWPDDFRRRVDPNTVLTEPALVPLLEQMSQSSVSILDVGAGPLTVLGTQYPGKTIRLSPVDPLADAYNVLLRSSGVAPPVPTTACSGEELTAHFAPESFDIAYARNALDHACNPVETVRQMLAVVRPGGHVALRHAPNEAENQKHAGLHQWNFGERDGHFLVTRGSRQWDVTEIVAPIADTRTYLETEMYRGVPGTWLVSVLTRHPSR